MKKDQINKQDERKEIFSDNREKARNAWLKMNQERLDEIEYKRIAYCRAALVCQLITLVALLFNLIYHCL